MKPKDFFDFSSSLVSTTVQAHTVNLNINENGVDDHLNLINGIYKGINFPVIFKQESGKKFTDILDTGWPNLYLISDKMKKILEENNLTGWQTFSIKLYDKKGNEITGYHGFSVTGHSGQTNYDESEIIEKKLVSTGPICRYFKGMSVEGWDGSDFFTPEKTSHIFITKRTAEILKKNKLTNLELKNLAEYEIPVRYIKRKTST